MAIPLNTIQMESYIGGNIEDFINEYKSINTQKAYRTNLRQIFKDLFGNPEFKFITKSNLESLTIRNLKDYFNNLAFQLNDADEPKYKNATINGRISAIKELYKFLHVEDVISYDVSKLYSLRAFPDTRQEIEMIPFDLAMKYIEFFSKEERGLEKSLITKLAIESALRAEELIGLDWKNFYESDDGIIIKSHGNKKGKGNKEFLDKIDKKLYEELLQLKAIGNNDKLFTLTYKQLTRMMDKTNEILNDTGINYSFHSFKKLAVTMCYLNNNNCIHTAQKKARHTNVNTTMRYLRLTDLNVTGIISAKMNTEEELYTTVTHEELLKGLSEMRPEMLLLLNNKLKINTKNT